MIKRKTKKRKTIRRKKKSIFSNFIFSFSIFSSIIILSGLGFLFFSPRFQIENLTISGNTNISTEEIERIAEEKIKTSFSLMGMDFVTESIFLSFGGKIEQIKKVIPEIERISIQKNFPSGISLEIVEKTPFAVWKYDKDEYVIDKNGSFIKNLEEGGDYSKLIKIEQKEFIDELNKKMIIEDIFFLEGKILSEGMEISNYDIFNDKLNVKTIAGFIIIFDLNQDLGWQSEKLVAVLEKNNHFRDIGNIEYIDLRFENQAVIKTI